MVTESDKIGEPKVSAGKMDEPNYLGEAGNKSHGDGNYELFSATGKESKSTASTELTEPFVAQQIFKISAIVHLSS